MASQKKFTYILERIKVNQMERKDMVSDGKPQKKNSICTENITIGITAKKYVFAVVTFVIIIMMICNFISEEGEKITQ